MTEENQKLLKKGGSVLCSVLGVSGLIALTLGGVALSLISTFGAIVGSRDGFFGCLFLVGILVSVVAALKLIRQLFVIASSLDDHSGSAQSTAAVVES